MNTTDAARLAGGEILRCDGCRKIFAAEGMEDAAAEHVCPACAEGIGADPAAWAAVCATKATWDAADDAARAACDAACNAAGRARATAWAAVWAACDAAKLAMIAYRAARTAAWATRGLAPETP